MTRLPFFIAIADGSWLRHSPPMETPPGPPLDDPAIRARTVRNLLITAPFLFVGSYALAAVQGAERWVCLLIAGIALAGCLGTALVIGGLGSNSRHVLTAVMIILPLVSWWLGVK